MTDNQKHPWAAAVEVFVFPGLDHVYNGERWVKGVIFLSDDLWELFCLSSMRRYIEG